MVLYPHCTMHPSVSLATGFSQPLLLTGHRAKLAWLGDGTHRAGCSPASTPAAMLCQQRSHGVVWRVDRSAPASSGHHPITPLGLASGNLNAGLTLLEFCLISALQRPDSSLIPFLPFCLWDVSLPLQAGIHYLH